MLNLKLSSLSVLRRLHSGTGGWHPETLSAIFVHMDESVKGLYACDPAKAFDYAMFARVAVDRLLVRPDEKSKDELIGRVVRETAHALNILWSKEGTPPFGEMRWQLFYNCMITARDSVRHLASVPPR